jgi:multicomponent K+:H+ antiporter subunit A
MPTILIFPFILLAIAILLTIVFSLPAIRPRLASERMGWILALFPAAAFTTILLAYAGKPAGTPLTFSTAWIPSMGINFSLYLDGLAALFALIITGIGTLIVIYAGYYFHGDETAWRFQAYTLVFMSAMLGVVLAGDLITLFLFWEGTSISSFLLIGYKYKEEAARKGAFKSLFITGGGGIALLAGFAFVMVVTGASDFETVLSSREVLQNSPLYPAFFGLIALGAFTKSAQVPAHIWLPEAMSAPTPASAFLHSATMVKAGIYLLARFNPVLGGNDTWFWTLTIFGFATMLTGAYLGLKQNDLKALLAYSTISQLGVLVALIGLGHEYAYKALVIGILAHALYKSSLFMSAGIIDHETGTRDLRLLGGLRKQMPILFILMLIPALSMAGLPPLFGFLAKETLLASAAHKDLSAVINIIFPLMTVLAGAMLLAQSGLLIRGTFLGRPADPKHPLHGHDPHWGFWLAPAIPAFLSLLVGLLSEPAFLVNFLADAAKSVFGASVKVSLALWTGLNIPLFLSIAAISLGSLLFWQLARIRPILTAILPNFSANSLYDATLRGIAWGAREATLLQRGQIRFYIGVMLFTTVAIFLSFGALPPLDTLQESLTFSSLTTYFPILRITTLLVALIGSLASVLILRDLHAILALGVSGLAVAGWMALEPAPDVALVQVVVDILATIILVLTLTIIPRKLRKKARQFTINRTRFGIFRDAFIASSLGLLVFVVSLTSLNTRNERTNLAEAYHVDGAKTLAGAKDMVGAIVVDFRAIDTMLEIMVFAFAALGIYTLLHFTVRKAKDSQVEPEENRNPPGEPRGSFGLPTSPFLHMLAYAILPLAVMLALTQLIYGHDQPGDGFTAGVTIGLAIASWYIIFGYNATKAKLTWLNPVRLIGIGLAIALGNALLGFVFGKGFFAPVDYGAMLGVSNYLPVGLVFTNALIFEVAICITILGASVLILDNLGHPTEADTESTALLKEIGQE